jgi:hypothetical protein
MRIRNHRVAVERSERHLDNITRHAFEAGHRYAAETAAVETCGITESVGRLSAMLELGAAEAAEAGDPLLAFELVDEAEAWHREVLALGYAVGRLRKGADRAWQAHRLDHELLRGD